MNSAKASPENKTGIIIPTQMALLKTMTSKIAGRTAASGAIPGRTTTGSAAPARATNGSAVPARSTNGSAVPARSSSLPALLAVNLLTGSRVILSVGLVLCILSGEPDRALALLAVIYGTDIMDGMLARRWHAVTRTGAHFDLTADIWFVVLACSALVLVGLMPLWFLLAASFKFAEFAATSYFLSAGVSGQRQSQVRGLPEVPRSPVFDTIGRLSGMLFMAAPVPAILLDRLMPLSLASILFTSLAVCICILALISSCRRLYLCSLVMKQKNHVKRALGHLQESR